MSVGRTTAILIALLVVSHTITHVWHSTSSSSSYSSSSRLFKRSEPDPSAYQCEAIKDQADQCAYALEYCSGVTPGVVNYIQFYYCAASGARPVVVLVLCAWLLFLFGFVGIAASDFFCPNLQTIASALHLSESLTGVTFLAFGNGSPDLFSTFSAMNSNMGSLALGELIGAASFIVSVIAGSMCAIKPFRTKKFSFFRDVSFFMLSIFLVLAIVSDGLIHIYEAILLILFYALYVAVVVGGNYYMKRRSNYRNLVERARLEYEENGGEMDTLLRENGWEDQEIQGDEMELYDEGFETEGYQGEYQDRRRPAHPKLRIRTSLFSAIEFKDVVQSLQQSSTRMYTRSHPEQDTDSVPMSPRGHHEQQEQRETSLHLAEEPRDLRLGRIRLPADTLARWNIDVRDIMFHLFPSLDGIGQKSLAGKVSSLLSAPVIFLLAITLPVVREDLKTQGIRLDEDAMAMLDDGAVTELGESTSVWSRWLTAVQLVCAPLFAATVLVMSGLPAAILLPVAAGVGILLSGAFWATTLPHRQPPLYWMMCFVGFGVAILWIYVIANEVVSVLQAIGMALGISDAILGLTVFALGNSLGDLVANVTMARLGYPMMAMSACFGGPMLNIMLGVGMGATYVTSQRQEPYAIDVSSTILVSATGLLVVLISMLVIVPLSHFRMSRMLGFASIGVYLICTAINLYIEITRS